MKQQYVAIENTNEIIALEQAELDKCIDIIHRRYGEIFASLECTINIRLIWAIRFNRKNIVMYRERPPAQKGYSGNIEICIKYRDLPIYGGEGNICADIWRCGKRYIRFPHDRLTYLDDFCEELDDILQHVEMFGISIFTNFARDYRDYIDDRDYNE